MRRYFKVFRHIFQNDFKEFLKYVIDISDCDRFTIKYFKHSTTSYIFDDEIEAFKRDLKHLTMKIAE